MNKCEGQGGSKKRRKRKRSIMVVREDCKLNGERGKMELEREEIRVKGGNE